MRERLGRELRWTLSLVVHARAGGGGCVLVSLLGRMGWGYGRIFLFLFFDKLGLWKNIMRGCLEMPNQTPNT
jgi:hypothetical protein